MATDLKLTQEEGAVLSPATSNQSLTDLLTLLRKSNNAFASVFFSWTLTQDERLELANWANSMQEDVCVFINDTDSKALVAQTGSSFAERLQVENYVGVSMIYNNLGLTALFASVPACWDFQKEMGRFVFAFRRNTLVTPNIANDEDFQALEANGYNFMVSLASATNIFNWPFPGCINSAFKWLDSFFCQIWMRRVLQNDFAVCLQSKGLIPYNATGQAILQTAVISAINSFVNFGSIQPNISLDQSQITQLKNDGLSQSQINSLASTGYFMQIKMSEVSSQIRAKHGSPEINFWYMDGQSVQRIIAKSIGVQ